jgi:methionyl aminopeptidase
MSYEDNLQNIDGWRNAGKIAAQALEYGVSLIKPGALFLDVSDKIEEKIIELGGIMAFPVQMSMDHVAAHYCADPNEQTIFEDQLVSLDVGVHIDGAIGDNACTVDLSGRYGDLVKSSREALNNAEKILGIGATLGEIGKTIQETIGSYGFSPIHNLSGHGLDLFNIHTFPSIPNFDTKDDTPLEKGMVIAIEPFATDGAGMIYETETANIFALAQKKPVRSPFAREVLKKIECYGGLPFTTRWLSRDIPLVKVNFALKELLKLGIIRQYPPLPDKNKGMVSQAENTFIIGETVERLTRAE